MNESSWEMKAYEHGALWAVHTASTVSRGKMIRIGSEFMNVQSLVDDLDHSGNMECSGILC